MPKSEAEIRASLDAVIEDVENNQRIFGWVSGNVGTLARETKELASTVERRFDAVERRFDAVERRFEAVDERFKSVDRRFDALEGRLDAFEENTNRHFGVLSDSIRKLDARLERLVGYIVRDERKEQ